MKKLTLLLALSAWLIGHAQITFNGSAISVGSTVDAKKTYGLKGDGTTNDYTALDAAINSLALSGGTTLILPKGVYKQDSPLEEIGFLKGKTYIIKGDGDVTIDFSANTGTGTCWNLTGTQGTATALKQNASIGDEKIITNTTGAVNGDIIYIASTDTWMDGITKREMVLVNYQSNDTIYLETMVQDSYVAANTTTAIMNAPIIQIENIKFIGNATKAQNGLSIQTAQNVVVKNCVFNGFDKINLFFQTVYGGRAENNVTNTSDYSGFGYGISMNATQNMVIDNNRLNWCNHCVEQGVLNRNCKVVNNTVTAASVYPLECHGSVIGGIWDNNTLYGGGFYMRGVNYTITNNNIYLNASCYAFNLAMEDNGGVNEFINIANNKVYTLNSAATGFLSMDFNGSNDTILDMNINNNVADVKNLAIYFVNSASQTGNYIRDINFSNNSVTMNDATDQIWQCADSVSYGTIRIKDSYLKATGYGFSMNGKTCGRILVDNLDLDCTTYPFSVTSSFNDLIIKNSYLKATTYNNIRVKQNFTYINNIQENLTDGGLHISSDTDVFTWDSNLSINCTGSISNSALSTNVGTNW